MQRITKILSAILLSLVLVFTFMLGTTDGKAVAKTNQTPDISQGDTLTESIKVGQDAVVITLKAKDGDKDKALSWSIYKKPVKGAVKLSSKVNKSGTSQIKVVYTRDFKYFDKDSFIIQVKDSKGAVDRITIEIEGRNTINYLALGDSISTGTIYPGASITPYVTNIYEYLQTQYVDCKVTFTNLSANGARSNELYHKLGLSEAASEDADTVKAIKEADIITISLGGNNLMQAAKDSTALGGYNFNKINEEVAKQGVIDFNDQWTAIIKRMKELNKEAQFIVNTVFNPYNTTDPLYDTVESYLYGEAETGIKGINDVINNNTELGYQVADVYTAYNQYNNKMGDITYFYPAPTDTMGKITRNPHPNAKGQSMITELVKGLLEL